MYSRSYNTSNRVPPNYHGTTIQVDEPKKTDDIIATDTTPEEANIDVDAFETKTYARVPLMDTPVYSSRKSRDVPVYSTRKPLEVPVYVEPITRNINIVDDDSIMNDTDIPVNINRGDIPQQQPLNENPEIPTKPSPEKPWKPDKPDKDHHVPNKTICADDILLIGLLIILLGCENVDMKLIIAIGALLFVGL